VPARQALEGLFFVIPGFPLDPGKLHPPRDARAIPEPVAVPRAPR